MPAKKSSSSRAAKSGQPITIGGVILILIVVLIWFFSGTSSEPRVEAFSPAAEAVGLVLGHERLGRRQRHAPSQGGGVCIVLRKRSFGAGGWSSLARNAAKASGLTTIGVWSSSASSAARRAASRMKSVRVFPRSLAARSMSPHLDSDLQDLVRVRHLCTSWRWPTLITVTNSSSPSIS